MKLSLLKIDRYGPLSLNKEMRFDDFNIIYSHNETGKTLTIDALIKFLLGSKKPIKNMFKELDRVEEEPNGYLVIEKSDKSTIKYPSKNVITDFFNGGPHKIENFVGYKGITEHDFRNIFIIRNSDLSLDNESGYFSNVTERLAGLQTSMIKKIKEKICDIAYITKKDRDFQSLKEFNLKQYIKDASDLLEALNVFQNEIKEKHIDSCEKNLGALELYIEDLTERIKTLEDASRYEKYTNGKKALEYYSNSLAELESLKNIDDSGFERFRDLTKEMQALKDREVNFEKEKSQLSLEAFELNNKRDDLTKQLMELNNKRADFDKAKEQLFNYEESAKKVKEYQKVKKPLGIIAATSFIAFLAYTFALFYYKHNISYIPDILFLIISILSFSLYMKGVIFEKQTLSNFFNIANALKNEESILNNNSPDAGAPTKSKILWGTFLLAFIKSKIDEFYKKDENLKKELERIAIELIYKKQTLKKLEESINNCKQTYETYKEELDALKKSSQCDTLESYADKLKKKRGYIKINNENYHYLEKTFGKPKADSLDEIVAFFSKEIEKYACESVDVKYDEALLQNLKKELSEYCEKRDNLRKTYSAYMERLKRFVEETNKIIKSEQIGVPIKSADSLIHVELLKQALNDFVNTYTKKREVALKAIELFDDIETEEIKKLKDIFNVNGQFNIDEYFSQITDGLYKKVSYNEEKRTIEVETASGLVLPVSSLSGGAYDQLYFLIRYLFAVKLMNEEKGFFILDDPFIKYDSVRLLRAIKLLFDMVLKGWQVLYFTAKDEVLEAVGSLKNNNVKILHLENYRW